MGRPPRGGPANPHFDPATLGQDAAKIAARANRFSKGGGGGNDGGAPKAVPPQKDKPLPAIKSFADIMAEKRAKKAGGAGVTAVGDKGKKRARDDDAGAPASKPAARPAAAPAAAAVSGKPLPKVKSFAEIMAEKKRKKQRVEAAPEPAPAPAPAPEPAPAPAPAPEPEPEPEPEPAAAPATTQDESFDAELAEMEAMLG